VVDYDPWLGNPVGVVEHNKFTSIKDSESSATIFNGPLHLPKDRQCRVYDITGRVVTPDKMRPGVYFVEIDGKITKKVVKIG